MAFFRCFYRYLCLMMRTGFIWLARCYQLCISPYLGNCCRFEPSCSNYFIEAVKHRGVVVGFLLSMKRLLKCHPYCHGGYDPVPHKYKDVP